MYAPDTVPFKTLVEKVNASFQDLRRVQNLARIWLNGVSPVIKNITGQLDVEVVGNLIAQALNGTSLPTFFNITDSISQILGNASGLIET